MNKSLLRRDQSHETELRFIMLETIREFAAAKLAESGELEKMSERHAEYFADLVDAAYPHLLGGAEMTSRLWQLEAEHDNLRAALDWALQGGDRVLGLRLAGALGEFWWRMGHHIAGQRQVNRALELLNGAPPQIQARVYIAAGLLAFATHDSMKARASYGSALAIQQRLGSKRDIALTTGLLSVYGIHEPAEIESAIKLCRQSLANLRNSGDRVAYSQVLNIYAELVRSSGDLVEARLAYEEVLAVARDLGDVYRESMQLANLGLLNLLEGDVITADLRFRESMSKAEETKIVGLSSPGFDFLAWTAVKVGNPRRAALLIGASEAVRMKHEILVQPGDLIGREQYLLAIREQLGEETFEALKAEGRAMTLQQAVSFALEGAQ
jgi:non-specific serine/threonine protein kinase